MSATEEDTKDPAAVSLGRRGGAKSTPAQKEAGRRNLRLAAARRKRLLKAQAAVASEVAVVGDTAEEKWEAGRRMLAAGASLAEVGRRLDLTRERVRQVLGEFAAECRAARQEGRLTP